MTDRLILTHLEQMDKNLFDAIWTPENAGMMVETAQALGAVFALVLVARIAFRTIARQEPIDFMKLGKPLLVAFVLVNWFAFSSGIFYLVRPVETVFKEAYANRVDLVDGLRMQRAELVEAMGRRVRDMRSSIAAKEQIEQAEESKTALGQNSGKENVSGSIFSEFFEKIFSVDWLVSNWVVNDASFAEVVQAILFWLGETAWEFGVYFVFLVRYICMAVLVIFGPVAMAASILPAFETAWKVWIGRAVSISFYGAVAYFFMMFLMVFIEYAIRADINMMQSNMATQESFMAYLKYSGNNMLGTTGVYCVALYVGAMAMLLVPKAATWIWPSEELRTASSFISGMADSAKTVGMIAVAVATAGVGAAVGGAAAAGGTGGAAAGGTAGAGAEGAAAGAGGAGPAGAGGGGAGGMDGLGAGSGMGGVGESPFVGGETFENVARNASEGLKEGHSGQESGESEEGNGMSPFADQLQDDADEERRNMEHARKLKEYVNLRHALGLYEQMLGEGRVDEFNDALRVARAVAGDPLQPDLSKHAGLKEMERMFTDMQTKTSAERQALIDDLEREIEKLEGTSGFAHGGGNIRTESFEDIETLREEAESLKRRMEQYEQSLHDGKQFEFQLAELAALLGRRKNTLGVQDYTLLDSLESCYLRSQNDSAKRQQVMRELDELIARYEQDMKSFAGGGKQ